MEEVAQRFERSRDHLRSVAYRILGSGAEAEDAVQEAWLRLSRAEAGSLDNLEGWLTTVVARISLDMLRSRGARREESFDADAAERTHASPAPDAEHEAALADSVGLALLVVLNTLSPPERLAFVLHDTFGLSFDEIARILERTPAAARQLASRARRRVRGGSDAPNEATAQQRRLVEAFLAALRAGDLQGLVAILHPDLVVRADATVGRGSAQEIHGALGWAQGAVRYPQLAQHAHAALVDGAVGLFTAGRRGKLVRVVRFGFAGDRITSIEIVADPSTLGAVELGVLES